MQGCDAGQDRDTERRGRMRCEPTASQHRAERSALVGFDGDPEPAVLGAPCIHRRQGRVRVLGEALDSLRGGRGGGRRDRNLVHDDLFSVLDHGLPALTRPWCNRFQGPRFGLALGHVGRMVPFGDVAYVIVQPCVGVKDASCVEVCPVDCIHTDDAADMYYIDPDECIDCGACVDPCPVDAIFPEDEVPGQWRDFIKINADYFKK